MGKRVFGVLNNYITGGIGFAPGNARPVVSAAIKAWDKYDFPAVLSP